MTRSRYTVAVAAVIAVLATACGDEPVPVARETTQQADWWLAAPPGDAELGLAVYAGQEGCHAYRGVDVTEFEDEVRIRARVDTIGAADCVGQRSVATVDVPLAEPVGDRTLTGCAAPEEGLRDPRLTDHDDVDDCRDRVPPP